MTEQARKNRGLVVRFMSATATANGKDGDPVKMYDLARRLHRLEATLSRLRAMLAIIPYMMRKNRSGLKLWRSGLLLRRSAASVTHKGIRAAIA